MLQHYLNKKISLEKIITKMCHNPAEMFQIEKRGYIRKGYFADLVLIDLDSPWKVEKKNILYKCNWSPFEGYIFDSKVTQTFVNGKLVFDEGQFNQELMGKRLTFKR